MLESMPEMKQVLPSASFYAFYGDALLGVGKPVEAESYLRKALAEDAAHEISQDVAKTLVGAVPLQLCQDRPRVPRPPEVSGVEEGLQFIQ